MQRFETLSNGLRAILVPCEAESVAFGIFIASGSRHEGRSVAGISHFIEHMLFKGTPTRGATEISRAIEGRGGMFNAFTSEEATCYYAHLPKEHMAEAVDILSDMYLHASIPEDEFAREKGVVVEELKMYADEPDAVAAENLQKAIFPGCPLGLPVGGTAESVSRMSPADLRRHMKAHYRPDATVVVMAGDFDEEEALRKIRRSLGRVRRPASPLRGAPRVNLAKRPAPETVVEKDVNQTQIAIGYRAFGVRDGRKYAATLMDAILGRGMSSRLFVEVREKRGLSYDIASRMQFFSDAGMFSVAAGVDGAKAEAAIATIERELRRMRERKVPAAELRRVKDFLLGNFRLSHEKVVAKMFFYGSSALAFGRPVTPEEQVKALSAVTAEEVQAVAKAVFRPENRSVSRVVPKGGEHETCRCRRDGDVVRFRR